MLVFPCTSHSSSVCLVMHYYGNTYTPLFLPPEDPSQVLLCPNSIPE
jgi:hypothetical protein